MAKPWRPFSRAAAMFSSGLETPSPEKNVCVWRSMLKAIAGRLVCAARNAKRRFQGTLADCLNQKLLFRSGQSFTVAMELHVVEPPVIDGFFQQLAVTADVFDEPLIHHHDLVRGKNRREPMRDRDHRASRGKNFERHLDLLFRFGIEGGGRF